MVRMIFAACQLKRQPYCYAIGVLLATTTSVTAIAKPVQVQESSLQSRPEPALTRSAEIDQRLTSRPTEESLSECSGSEPQAVTPRDTTSLISALGVKSNLSRSKHRKSSGSKRTDSKNSVLTSSSQPAVSMHIVPPLPAVKLSDKQNPFAGFDLNAKPKVFGVPR
jgi:hypothetical protein